MGNDSNQHDADPCPTCGGRGCPVCKGTGLASKRVGRWSSEENDDTGDRIEVETKGGDDPKSQTERVPIRDLSASTTTTEPEVNGIAWRLGWHPFLVVVGITLLSAFGFAFLGADYLLVGFVLGVPIGVAVWYWGVREITNNYETFVQKFISESERKAEQGIRATDPLTYLLPYGSGKSPPLTKAFRTYYTTTITLTDVSVIINKDAEYDLQSQELAERGSSHEIFYEQISAVDSYQMGENTALEIRAFDGNSVVISPFVTETASEALSELRQRIRQHVRGNEEPLSGLVIDDVREERGERYVVLRNASGETVDLSGASITDGADNRFRFAKDFALEPGQTERFRVHESFAPDPDSTFTLTARDGEEYEIR